MHIETQPSSYIKATVLGCGPSGGVPHLIKGWGDCSPHNPKNRRMRSSLLIDTPDQQRILIDTSPDSYQQFINADIRTLDAVLYTHAHADHTHGIDSLRWICQNMQKPLPIYAHAETLDALKESFSYAFSEMKGNYYYKPCLIPHIINPGEVFYIGQTKITSFLQDHGKKAPQTLGFSFNDSFVYSTDAVDFPEISYSFLKSIDIHTWIIGVLGYTPHPTHAHVEKALQWISDLNPKHAFFTHMEQTLDYDKLCKILPDHVKPCYDGIKIIVPQ